MKGHPVPTLPKLDGVSFRTFRDESDYPHFARIITASERADGTDRVETEEGLASAYDHLDRCDRKRDMLVAEVDGRPVGSSRLWWDQEPDGPRIYRPYFRFGEQWSYGVRNRYMSYDRHNGANIDKEYVLVLRRTRRRPQPPR